MSSVVKVYNEDEQTFFYFINGSRSDAYDDRSVLDALLGEAFQEFVVVSERNRSEIDRETISLMEAAESFDEFEEIIEENPHLIEEL